MTIRIAVLMTSYNRSKKTAASLASLRAQTLGDWAVHVYFLDDGSSDTTAEVAKNSGVPITVIAGQGDLYWSGGMCLAERAAMRDDPDMLLWLNDDVVLVEDALQRLVACAQEYPGAIVVGATVSAVSGEVTYGARVRTSAWHPQRFALLGVSDDARNADTFNGNVVLIPRVAREAVGPIDGRFPHAYADDDYGLRARAIGISILQARGVVGYCERDEQRIAVRGLRPWLDAQTTKGTPFRAQARFFRRHGGRLWPLILLGQQVRQLVPASPAPRVMRSSTSLKGAAEL